MKIWYFHAESLFLKMATKYIKVYNYAVHGSNPQEDNSVRTIDIEGKRICLARIQNKYYAIDDRCPHAGARLGAGFCDENGMVVCPVHRYKYNPQTGKGANNQGDFVATYPVQEKPDGLYIGIEKKWWQF